MSVAETQDLDFTLTPIDKDLVKTLRTLCKVDGKATFSADDFRMYGLDRFLHGGKAVGGWFAKLKHNGLAEPTGEWVRSRLPSNRLRKIPKWRFLEK